MLEYWNTKISEINKNWMYEMSSLLNTLCLHCPLDRVLRMPIWFSPSPVLHMTPKSSHHLFADVVPKSSLGLLNSAAESARKSWSYLRLALPNGADCASTKKPHLALQFHEQEARSENQINLSHRSRLINIKGLYTLVLTLIWSAGIDSAMSGDALPWTQLPLLGKVK